MSIIATFRILLGNTIGYICTYGKGKYGFMCTAAGGTSYRRASEARDASHFHAKAANA
jgi:hypothetical protein